MSVKERLKTFIEYLEISVSEFEKSIGASNGYVNNISKSIGVDRIESILDQYSILNIDWLFTGRGKMLRKEGDSTYKISDYEEKVVNEPIPVYGLTVSAGVISIFNDSKNNIPIDYISIPGAPKCDGATRITGDSMYPLLKAGDLALYKILHDKQNIIWGEMYIMYINNIGDEFLFVKWLHPSDKPGWVKLVSENKHHAPVEFPIDSVLQLAMVKTTIRFNTHI